MASRRTILQRLTGVASAVGLSGCARVLSSAEPRTHDIGLPPNPYASELPVRQHAQNAFQRKDAAGNYIPPRHHAVLLLDLDEPPSISAARTVERAMRTIESVYEWSSSGLFHMLAWGPPYFERLGSLSRAPVRHPEVVSRTAEPDLQGYDAALVLSSDVPSRLSAVETAMFDERATLNGEPVTHRLGGVFSITEKRTGFVGEGLPAAHSEAEGLPKNPPLADAPMFMGFRSKRRGTQASENRVTIDSESFTGGTTMNLGHFQLSLGGWYESLSEAGRVARMFSPEFSPSEVAGFADDVPFSAAVRKHAAKYSVVGHHEKVARVRKDGEPRILRRDFNTVDGGHAGVHFLSLQRSLSDFVRTRKAMNGWYLRDESREIADEENNGILNFITPVSRTVFYVPLRTRRAFPLL